FAGVRRVLPATLVLAGDGPERDLAEQEVDRLKLRGDVRFLGKVDQVAELLRGGICFCCRRRANRSGCRRSRRWRAACPSWRPARVACRRWWWTAKPGIWPRSARWTR